MGTFIYFLVFCRAVVVMGETCPPLEIAVLGLGYDALAGDPSIGFSDPGLKITHRIIDSGNQCRTVNYANFKEPRVISDGVIYFRKNVCLLEKSRDLILGTESFLKALKKHFFIDDSSISYRDYFDHSKGMSGIRKLVENGDIFLDDTMFCSLGEARFIAEGLKNIDQEFKGDILNLNTKNPADVSAFVNKWGTHAVTKVQFGMKTYKSYISDLNTLMHYVLKEDGKVAKICRNKISSVYKVHIDTKQLQVFLDSARKLPSNAFTPIAPREFAGTTNSNEPFTSTSFGSLTSPEHIRLALTPIAHIVSKVTDLAVLSKNFTDAMNIYLTANSGHQHKDENLILLIKWPSGRYAIPMGKEGCPHGGNWETGWRMQDSPARYKNFWTDCALDNWPEGALSTYSINQTFCVKEETIASPNEDNWPRGTYCILKKGSCPRSFNESTVKWKDNEVNSRNAFGGTLPNGKFTLKSTEIGYCCRKDGDVNTPIVLPALNSFYLYKSAGAGGCQSVFGMKVQLEEIGWGTSSLNYMFAPTKVSKNVFKTNSYGYGSYTTVITETPYLPEYLTSSYENLQVKLRYCHYQPTEADFCRSCPDCEFSQMKEQ